MGSKQPLKLESGAAQEGGVIDALPYIDGITTEDRLQAEELVKEEVRAPSGNWCLLPHV